MVLQKYSRVTGGDSPLFVGESLEPSEILMYKYIPMEYLISSLKRNEMYLYLPSSGMTRSK